MALSSPVRRWLALWLVEILLIQPAGAAFGPPVTRAAAATGTAFQGQALAVCALPALRHLLKTPGKRVLIPRAWSADIVPSAAKQTRSLDWRRSIRLTVSAALFMVVISAGRRVVQGPIFPAPPPEVVRWEPGAHLLDRYKKMLLDERLSSELAESTIYGITDRNLPLTFASLQFLEDKSREDRTLQFAERWLMLWELHNDELAREPIAEIVKRSDVLGPPRPLDEKYADADFRLTSAIAWTLHVRLANYDYRNHNRPPDDFTDLHGPLVNTLRDVLPELQTLSPEQQDAAAWRLVTLLVKQRQAYREDSQVIFGRGRPVILIADERMRKNLRRDVEALKQFGADDVRSFIGLPQTAANIELKRQIFEQIEQYSASGEPVTIASDGHGWDYWFTLAPRPESADQSEWRAYGIAHRELAEALMNGQRDRAEVDLSHFIFFLSGCRLYDFYWNTRAADQGLIGDLQEIARSRRQKIRAMPVFIAAANRNALSHRGLWQAVIRQSRTQHGRPLTTGGLLKLLADGVPSDMPAVFIPFGNVHDALELPRPEQEHPFLEIGRASRPSSYPSPIYTAHLGRLTPFSPRGWATSSQLGRHFGEMAAIAGRRGRLRRAA